VLIGDATAAEVLRKVDIRRAAYVVALCGDSGINATVAATVQTLDPGPAHAVDLPGARARTEPVPAADRPAPVVRR
jgi:hypothetical protein